MGFSSIDRNPGPHETPAGGRWREATLPLPAITSALSKQRSAIQLARIRSSRAGRSLLKGRPEVDRESCDCEQLLRLPHGTFGHELARWMLDNGLEPRLGAVEACAGKSACAAGRDTEKAYLGRRLIEVHDLWHVLSGYNCDLAGEFGVLAFTLGQGHLRGVGPMLAGALRRFQDPLEHSPQERAELARYLWRAYRRGRRARFLAPLTLEEYFMLPIDSVRQRLRIEPCEETLNADALPPIAVRPPNEHGLLPT